MERPKLCIAATLVCAAALVLICEFLIAPRVDPGWFWAAAWHPGMWAILLVPFYTLITWVDRQ